MNEFDQFVKRELKVRYYLRYADDFVILSVNRDWLLQLILPISNFLSSKLRLTLHPQKVFITTLASGIDFLGWVHFTNYRVLRPATKKRMFRKLQGAFNKPEVVQSYLGILSHGNTYRLQREVIQKSARKC